MRCEVCWMTCVLFRVSVSVLRSPSSSPEPFSVPFTELFHRNYPPSPVHQIHLAAPFTSTVLRPRLLNRPPSRSPSEQYRDAFAASDADVNEAGGVGRELIAVKIPCNAS